MNADALRLQIIDLLRHPEELGVGYCARCGDILDAGNIEVDPWAEKIARQFEDRIIEIVVRVT